jgi:hypothetical protein
MSIKTLPTVFDGIWARIYERPKSVCATFWGKIWPCRNLQLMLDIPAERISI